MRHTIQALAGTMAVIALCAALWSPTALAQGTPTALIQTSLGEIELELFPEQAAGAVLSAAVQLTMLVPGAALLM